MVSYPILEIKYNEVTRWKLDMIDKTIEIKMYWIKIIKKKKKKWKRIGDIFIYQWMVFDDNFKPRSVWEVKIEDFVDGGRIPGASAPARPHYI